MPVYLEGALNLTLSSFAERQLYCYFRESPAILTNNKNQICFQARSIHILTGKDQVRWCYTHRFKCIIALNCNKNGNIYKPIVTHFPTVWWHLFDKHKQTYICIHICWYMLNQAIISYSRSCTICVQSYLSNHSFCISLHNTVTNYSSISNLIGNTKYRYFPFALNSFCQDSWDHSLGYSFPFEPDLKSHIYS